MDADVLIQVGSNLVTLAGGYLAGRRGRVASARREEADAAESLSTTVVRLDGQMAALRRDLYDAQSRAMQAEIRATAAEQRAAAAELRAATGEAEVATLRTEVARMRDELARYEAAVPPPPPSSA